MSHSVTEVVRQRQAHIQKIERHFRQLNRNFRRNSLGDNVDSINDLITHLIQLNAEMEERKVELNQTCVSKGVKGFFWKAFLVIGFGAEVTALVIDTVYNREKPRELIPLSFNITSVVSLAVAGVFNWYYTKDRQKEEGYLERIRLDNRDERNFQRFVSTLNEFKEASLKKEKENKFLKQVIHEYDALDPKYQIGNRALMIKKLIKLLPDGHPLKDELDELYKAAKTLKQKQKNKRQHGTKKFHGEKAGFNEEVEEELEDYQERWEKFEDKLGCRLEKVEYDGLILGNDGICDEVENESEGDTGDAEENC